MADDGGSEEPRLPEPEPPRSAHEPPRRSWISQNRTLAMALGCVALCGVIGLNVYFIVKLDQKREQEPSATSSAAAVAPPPVASAPLAAPSTDAAPLAEDGGDVFDYSDDGEPREPKPAAPKKFTTVAQAAVESCTTASVDGLSRQIIAQARCIKPNQFVPLPSRPNLVIASQVFPYLELEAKNRLLKALDSKPKQKMTINSALRTVAQQYLVWRWSATKRCGVPLATPPGESNHEIGTALDIAEAGTWRPTLEAQQFKWLGPSDRVHFDYRGGGPSASTGVDVMAFQKLWNRNHPTDKIAEDGRYNPAVEQRLKQAPPEGFPLGASCNKR
jgi:hypothetical protein